MHIVQFSYLREDAQDFRIRPVLYTLVPQIAPFDQRARLQPIGTHLVYAGVRLPFGLAAWLGNS